MYNFCGEETYDISGGIFDKSSPAYFVIIKKALRSGKNFSFFGETWWYR